MSCDKYLELLSARLDGALTGEEERELEEHLAICPGCVFLPGSGSAAGCAPRGFP